MVTVIEAWFVDYQSLNMFVKASACERPRALFIRSFKFVDVSVQDSRDKGQYIIS